MHQGTGCNKINTKTLYSKLHGAQFKMKTLQTTKYKVHHQNEQNLGCKILGAPIKLQRHYAVNYRVHNYKDSRQEDECAKSRAYLHTKKTFK